MVGYPPIALPLVVVVGGAIADGGACAVMVGGMVLKGGCCDGDPPV